MTKRVVEVSRFPAKVSTIHKQILIARAGEGEVKELKVPAEDLGVLILDHPQSSVTLPALARISANGGIVVVCGEKHLPVSVLLPIADHTQTVIRIRDQIAAGRPLVKRLWKQVIQAKIKAQARNLPLGSAARDKLLVLAGKVRSGDAGNHEAQAARIYWPRWAVQFDGFKRDPEGTGINGLLNYGYAIVRAATARALVGSGFCTAIGLHHRNRGNPFCLADDMMEPLRPLVDRRVSEIAGGAEAEITTDSKAALLGLLLDSVFLEGQQLPLMDAMHRTAASLAACLCGEGEALLLPEAEEA